MESSENRSEHRRVIKTETSKEKVKNYEAMMSDFGNKFAKENILKSQELYRNHESKFRTLNFDSKMSSLNVRNNTLPVSYTHLTLPTICSV